MAWGGLYMQLLQKLAISHYSSLMSYIQMTGHYARRQLHTVSTTTVRWRPMRSMRCFVGPAYGCRCRRRSCDFGIKQNDYRVFL